MTEKDSLTHEEITQNYDFDARQTNYYSDAGRYLGLIDKTNRIFTLTDLGIKVFNKPIFERNLDFIRLILLHSAFKKTLKLYFENGKIPSGNEIVEIMKSGNLHNVKKDSTFERRARTVKSWVDWIIDQNEE